MTGKTSNDRLTINEKHNGSNQIVVQAGILATASIVVRIIGLLYQSPLTAIIGDEGNGYYSLAYNIYTIILLISSYSIPSAISKIMAQKLALGEYRNVQRIFKASLIYVVVIGTAFGLFMYFGASLLVGPKSVPVLRVFAPTILLFGILGVLRGYFQAHNSMVQTSLSQILEQIVNAGMSLFAAWFLMRQVSGSNHTTKAVYGASGSALGTGCGVLAGLLFMLWVYSLNRGRIKKLCSNDVYSEDDSYKSIFREVIRVVTPFVLSSFILNLTTTLNQTIFTKVLMNFRDMDESMVTMIYGVFSRKATVITNIPISIATATAAAVIPSLSSAFATGDKRETLSRSRSAERLTAIIAVPSAVGLMVLAKPITMLLYPQMQTLDQASLLLTALAVTVFFYSISTITNAILQATEHMNLPIVSAAIALIVQTVVLVVLLVKTDLGIYSLVIASIIYSVMIFTANEFFMKRYLGKRANLGFGGQGYKNIIIAAMVMGAACFGIYSGMRQIMGRLGFGSYDVLIGHSSTDVPLAEQYFANLVAVIPALLVAVLVYGFMLVKLGTLTEEDLKGLPKGNTMIRILKKLRWM